MALWKCEGCGFEAKGNCRPKVCTGCGAPKESFLKSEEGKAKTAKPPVKAKPQTKTASKTTKKK